jgi:ribosomal protein S12 methylthiotransferase
VASTFLKPLKISKAEGLARDGVKRVNFDCTGFNYYGLDIYKKSCGTFRSIGKVEGIEWIRLHYAFLQVFYGRIGVMKREPKFVIILIFRCSISDSILKSMRRGTTQEKTTKLLKISSAAVPGIAIRCNIDGRCQVKPRRFQYIKRLGSRNEIDRNGLFRLLS